MNNPRLSFVVALVAVIIAIGSYFIHGSSAPLGSANGPQHWSLESFIQGLQIGQRGTEIKNVLTGRCSLIASNYSIAASTTVAMDCAITGATSADNVFGMFATSTAGGAGWEIIGAAASNTPGFDTFQVTNGTGVTAVIPASVASTTRYFNIR